MIAIITSTLQPDNNKSFYSHTERVEQTLNTLNSLKQAGFQKIYLIDNSPGIYKSDVQQLLNNHDVEVFHVDQYQFENKGVNELLMLLYLCRHLPADEIIFKISGRYTVSAGFKVPVFTDLAVKGYKFEQRSGLISTRAYWVKNTRLLERFVNETLSEVFAYPERVVGLNSFIKTLKNQFGTRSKPINVSIEFAAAIILKRFAYDVSLLDQLYIEGLVAGSGISEKIEE